MIQLKQKIFTQRRKPDDILGVETSVISLMNQRFKRLGVQIVRKAGQYRLCDVRITQRQGLHIDLPGFPVSRDD